jgi:voltage-gated potassium channel
MFPNVNVIVSLNNSKLKETFSTAGVTYAISKESVLSKLVASYIFEPDVAEITEDIMAVAEGKDNYDLQEYRIKSINPFLNKHCLDVFMELKLKYNCILMGISKKESDGKWNVIRNPGKETIVLENDYVIILANGETKLHIQETFQVLEGRME